MSRFVFRSAGLLTAALFLFTAAASARQPVNSESPDLTGKYELAGGGYLVVSVDDAGLAVGFFERNGEFGRLSGRVDAGALSGVWVQEKGSAACETRVEGSQYWGRISLSRNADGNVEPTWSECQTPQAATTR